MNILDAYIANRPAILDLWPAPMLSRLRGELLPAQYARPVFNDAKRWRFRYLLAWRRSKRHRKGSRGWLKHRRAMVRCRHRIRALGHDVMCPQSPGYELREERTW